MKNSALLLGVTLLGGCVSTTVGPGQIGVLWTAAAGTQSQTFGEGAHNLAGDDVMSVFDLRTTSHDEALAVIASNGLGIKLDASILYHLDAREVVQLQKEIGPEYYAKILAPVLRSEARRVIGQYSPKRSIRPSAISSSGKSSTGWRRRLRDVTSCSRRC